MSDALRELKEGFAQCDRLISGAHREDSSGTPLFSTLDRQQITEAAFLNMFIAWESYLERSLLLLMAGGGTLSGQSPISRIRAPNINVAREIAQGMGRFFDYGNHDNFKKIVNIYFEGGYPFEPHIGSIFKDLQDLRTIRNACAHITSSTRVPLEGLALRLLGAPIPDINAYKILMANDPRVSSSRSTIFQAFRDTLIATAEMISRG